MKELLALKGINSVSYTGIDKIEHTFAYTDNMLENWIFLELYEEEPFDEESDEGYKTCIDVFMMTEGKGYEYTILLDPRPYVPPAYVYRIILDTVKIIKYSDPQSLTDQLKVFAMASMCAEDYSSQQDQDEFNDKVRQRINKVLALMEHSNVVPTRASLRRIDSRIKRSDGSN